MTIVDILICVALLLFAVKGFMKGFVREVCSLLGLIMGGWAAFKYYTYVAEAIRAFIHLPQQVVLVLSFILIFLVLGLLFFLFGHVLTVVFKIMLLGGVNRIGGVFFGLLQGAFIICVVLYLGTTKPVPEKLRGHILRSKTARPLVMTGKEIISGWDGAVQQGKSAEPRR